MKNFHKIIGILFLVLGGIVLAVYASQEEIEKYLSQKYLQDLRDNSALSELQDRASDTIAKLPVVKDIVRQENLPSPLRLKNENDELGQLTVSGVIKFTNRHRAQSGGLPALRENVKLNAAALAKAQDIIDRQYFAHVAPDGTTPAQLIAKAGYNYINTGENLAMGNFASDEALVQAWMDSIGHRENILKKEFSEIGTAVIQGVYEGQEVWVAVQEFGKPLSDCPSVSQSLSAEIDRLETQIKSTKIDLDNKKAELEKFSKLNPAYNKKVIEYNSLARAYNELVEEAKAKIATYNEQVMLFNVCAGS